jgi:cell division protein ZapA (FtsZ GTPase activity inhibitor)
VSASGQGDEPAAPRRVELRVLGQTLALRTGAPPEYLRSLAGYIEERVAAIQRSGVRDSTTALLLAALDIADELFRAREDRVRGQQDVGSRLDALVSLLDSVTREPGPPGDARRARPAPRDA